MELDDFKSLLKAQQEETPVTRSAEELEQYTRKTAISVMAKIKKNIRFELRLCIWILPPFAALCFIFPSLYMRSIVGLSVFVCLFFAVYLLKLTKKINYYETTSFSVKESLQQVIDILSRFI